jgi:hypothetical protein
LPRGPSVLTEPLRGVEAEAVGEERANELGDPDRCERIEELLLTVSKAAGLAHRELPSAHDRALRNEVELLPEDELHRSRMEVIVVHDRHVAGT